MKCLIPLFAIVLTATVLSGKETIQVRLKTNHGNILLELDREKAPITVENFLKYVREKHYNDTVFHRVIDGFMIQGGGFTIEKNRITEKEVSGSGIKNEGNNGLKNLRGTIAMARTNDINSARAQFFINVNDNASLDFPSMGGYAVFGKVVEGMDVVDKIKATKTQTTPIAMRHPVTGEILEHPAGDVPVNPITIVKAEIVE